MGPTVGWGIHDFGKVLKLKGVIAPVYNFLTTSCRLMKKGISVRNGKTSTINYKYSLKESAEADVN